MSGCFAFHFDAVTSVALESRCEDVAVVGRRDVAGGGNPGEYFASRAAGLSVHKIGPVRLGNALIAQEGIHRWLVRVLDAVAEAVGIRTFLPRLDSKVIGAGQQGQRYGFVGRVWILTAAQDMVARVFQVQVASASC